MVKINRYILGQQIKKVRGNKSQDVFASEIGISRGALSYYENGDRIPSAETIYNICFINNVSANELLGLTNNIATKKIYDRKGAIETLLQNQEDKIKLLEHYNETLKDIINEVE